MPMTKLGGNSIWGSQNAASSNSRLALARIGELLVAANIIKPEVLNESLQISKTSKTLIGRTLVRLGQIDDHKLQAVLDTQTLIRKGLVSTQLGIKALGIACSLKIPVEEALGKLGWQPPTLATANYESDLARLIMQSELISQQVLEQVEQQSKENNLPLGRCLIVNRHITQDGLEAVLSAQSLLRDRHITEKTSPNSY